MRWLKIALQSVKAWVAVITVRRTERQNAERLSKIKKLSMLGQSNLFTILCKCHLFFLKKRNYTSEHKRCRTIHKLTWINLL